MKKIPKLSRIPRKPRTNITLSGSVISIEKGSDAWSNASDDPVSISQVRSSVYDKSKDILNSLVEYSNVFNRGAALLSSVINSEASSNFHEWEEIHDIVNRLNLSDIMRTYSITEPSDLANKSALSTFMMPAHALSLIRENDLEKTLYLISRQGDAWVNYAHALDVITDLQADNAHLACALINDAIANPDSKEKATLAVVALDALLPILSIAEGHSKKLSSSSILGIPVPKDLLATLPELNHTYPLNKEGNSQLVDTSEQVLVGDVFSAVAESIAKNGGIAAQALSNLTKDPSLRTAADVIKASVAIPANAVLSMLGIDDNSSAASSVAETTNKIQACEQAANLLREQLANNIDYMNYTSPISQSESNHDRTAVEALNATATTNNLNKILKGLEKMDSVEQAWSQPQYLATSSLIPERASVTSPLLMLPSTIKLQSNPVPVDESIYSIHLNSGDVMNWLSTFILSIPEFNVCVERIEKETKMDCDASRWFTWFIMRMTSKFESSLKWDNSVKNGNAMGVFQLTPIAVEELKRRSLIPNSVTLSAGRTTSSFLDNLRCLFAYLTMYVTTDKGTYPELVLSYSEDLKGLEEYDIIMLALLLRYRFVMGPSQQVKTSKVTNLLKSQFSDIINAIKKGDIAG